jgi:hypothetical protein
MYRLRGLVVAVAVGLSAVGAAGAQTVEDALKAVPEDALGFIVVNSISGVCDKIESVAKRVGSPLPFSPLDKLKTDTNIDKGVNFKGSMLVAIMGGGGGQPAPVVYLPVSNYDEFVKSVGGKAGGDVVEVTLGRGPAVAAKKGQFALVTQPQYRDALEQALKATTAGSKLAPVQQWVIDNDISAVLPAKTVQLLALMGQQGLGIVKQFAGNLPKEAQAAMGMLDGVDSLLGSLGTDVSNLGLGAKVDQSGNVGLGLLALFVPNSGFAKAGAEARLPEGGPLAGLPGVEYAISFGGAVSEKTMQAMTNMGTQMLGAMAKQDPATLQKLEVAAADMVKGMRGMGMVLGVGKGKASIFDGTYVVMKVADTKAYLKNYKTYIKVYNEAFKDADIPGATDMTIKDVTVDGLPGVELDMKMRGLDTLPAQQRQMMALYFDPEGKLKASLTAVDNNTILMRYTPPEGLKEYIKLYRANPDGLSRDKELGKTVALLPQGSRILFFINPSGTVDLVNRVLGLMPQAGGFQLPLFPATPPMGFGCKLTATGFESSFVIPGSTLQQVGAYVRQLQKDRGALQ